MTMPFLGAALDRWDRENPETFRLNTRVSHHPLQIISMP
jgi:hypothetical protein